MRAAHASHATIHVLLAGVALHAQQSTPKEQIEARLTPDIVAMLASDNAKEIAWGAYLAQRYRLTGLGQPIVTAMERVKNDRGRQADAARLLLVDAAWALDASVDVDLLIPLLDRDATRVPALLCLAKDTKTNAAAIAAVAMSERAVPPGVRIAAGTFLIRHRAIVPGFARYLLERANYRCRLEVVDPGGSGSAPATVGLGGVADRFVPLEGFPPLPEHRLALNDEAVIDRGAVVVHRDNDIQIFHTRKETHRLDLQGWKHSEPDGWFVRVWLGDMSAVDWPRGQDRTLIWRGPAAFVEEAASAQAQLRADLDRTMAGLVEAGWLPADERKEIPFETVVVDSRTERKEPLPALGPTGAGR